jgi:hypothetical protein
MTSHISFLLATSLAVTACVDQKGDEEDIPVDGKDDSFVNPSHHGVMKFGVDNSATITATEGFHTWTFTLSGSASVQLDAVAGSANLDTVMYLYKRTSSTASWGAYIEKNDDASDDTTSSRIKKTFSKGEYRVLVKGYKRAMRGELDVRATCTGSGCPTSTCTAAAQLPAITEYGGNCGTRIAKVYEFASVDSQVNSDVDYADRCSLSELERLGVDFYVSLFGVDGINADRLEVSVRKLRGTGANGGSIVDVGDGGDESTVSFVFDSSNKLLLHFWHNQSPEVGFYCRTSGAVVSLPDAESCASSLVSDLPHNAGNESVVNLTAAPNNLPVGLGAEVSKPMQRYAAKHGTAASTALTVAGAKWTLFGGKASRLEVSAPNAPKTTFLATNSRIVLETTGTTSALVCE